MAWIKANDNHWYNCESMAFANKQQVKRLTDADWQALKGIVYCLVKGNPYETGLTSLDPPLGYLPGGYNGARDKAWVSGSLVHMHSERVRNLATQVALDRSLLHQPAGIPSDSSEFLRAQGWIAPASIGIHCEAQDNAQCGAHAMNALMYRAATTGPHYLYQKLKNSLRAAQISGVSSDSILQDEFWRAGWYSPYALNHFLYEYSRDLVALVGVADFRHAGTDSYRAADNLITKTDILNRAPQGCRSLLIYYEHVNAEGRAIPHYKAWVEQHGVWYECESFAYADHKLVKPLSDDDWQTLQGTCVMSLATANPFTAGNCLVMPPLGALVHVPEPRTLSWADGSQIAITSTPCRMVRDAWHDLNGTCPNAGTATRATKRRNRASPVSKSTQATLPADDDTSAKKPKQMHGPLKRADTVGQEQAKAHKRARTSAPSTTHGYQPHNLPSSFTIGRAQIPISHATRRRHSAKAKCTKKLYPKPRHRHPQQPLYGRLRRVAKLATLLLHKRQ
jgi:hypothetical protein